MTDKRIPDVSGILQLPIPDRWILFGGGVHLHRLAGCLAAKEQAVTVVTSVRHGAEILPGGRTFLDCLKADGVAHLLSDDANADPAVLELIGGATIGLSVSAPWIFKHDIIDKFGGRLFNSHGARLPRDRGGGGFSWRILRDERNGCSTLHEVAPRIDGGRIVEMHEYTFPSDARTPADYMAAALENDIAMLEGFVTKVLGGAPITTAAQDEHTATYWPRLNTDIHGHIDWNSSAFNVERFICAFDDPYPGARTTVNGDRAVRLKDCHASLSDGAFHPFQAGMVFRKSADALYVALIDGSLIVRRVLSEDGANTLEDVRLGDRFVTPVSALEKARTTRASYTARGLNKENKN